MTLNVSHLTGGYYQKEVISDIHFTINPGEIVALIGLNGAGKSTIIRHIMGVLKPFSGSVTINKDSTNLREADYFKSIGYIPETPLLYEELTLKEHIELTAISHDLSPEEALKRAESLLKIFRLENYLDWFPVDFSKGMKQKVMVICALIIKPKVLIIDEPFIGLDPLAMNDLIHLIEDAKNQGTAILMSTHVLENVQKMCDRMIILDGGRILSQGTYSDIAKRFNIKSNSLDTLFLEVLDVNRNVVKSHA